MNVPGHIYSMRREEWMLMYFGIAILSWPGSYPVTTMQQIICTGKRYDWFFKMYPYSFAILQDV